MSQVVPTQPDGTSTSMTNPDARADAGTAFISPVAASPVAVNSVAVNSVAEAANKTAPAPRIHYLDNLRALAMLLGIFLHAGLAYANPGQSFWLATDHSSSVLVDVAIWFIHLFRMALFFLISGYFASLMIERKGVGRFVWGRVVRIVFPFLLFYPFLVAAMTICIVFALSYVSQPEGLLGVIYRATKSQSGPGEPPPLTTMHLWFLYYLFMFNVSFVLFALVQRKYFPNRSVGNWIWILCPLMLVPGAIAGGVPMAAPESFIPTWWPFCFYGFFFGLGAWCHGRENKLDLVSRHAVPLAIASGVLFVIYYILMPRLDILNFVPLDQFRSILLAVIGSALSLFLVLLALAVGKMCLNRRNAILSFMSDSSYWMYLIHLPIVVLIQTLLIETSLHVWLKLAITVLATCASCLMSYVVFVRYTPIGWLLHGRRSFP